MLTILHRYNSPELGSSQGRNGDRGINGRRSIGWMSSHWFEARDLSQTGDGDGTASVSRGWRLPAQATMEPIVVVVNQIAVKSRLELFERFKGVAA